jgi:soluble lytic murein transglycosylase-like protein
MTSYRGLIEATAKTYGIDPNLLEAVVIAESNGCTDAFRFEPGFYVRYLKGKPEYAGQEPRRISSSYGLAQTMYTTAQQYGFSDQPEVLFVPDVGLKFGAMHLKHLLTWAGGDARKALAGYNGGQGNFMGSDAQRYASRVMKLYASVQQAHPEQV